MFLLLDESVPKGLRRYLPSHDARTVVEQGWGGVKNGMLLSLAAAASFEAFITVDKNLPYQQNLKLIPIAVVLLSAASNELRVLTPLIPKLEAVLLRIQPRSFVQIDA